MKDIRNKITIFVMIITLSTGVANVLSTSDIYADEFDGDISENPWSDLFKGDKGQDKVTIDDPGETTKNTVDTTTKITKNDVKKALKTSIKSATKKSKKAKKAKIVLKKITKIKGVRYQIKYAANKKFKKAKVKTYKKNKITLKKLKAKKRYYIKARAFVNAGKGKKVYGKWTKRRQIKVKKKK